MVGEVDLVVLVVAELNMRAEVAEAVVVVEVADIAEVVVEEVEVEVVASELS